jgi:energy-coupling factor transporter ATP-binding protein EcfA2
MMILEVMKLYNEVFIKSSEHVFICGATGTGKSVLAKAYATGYKNVVVLDSKGTFKFEPFLICDKDYIIVTDINMLYTNTKYNKIVYRPDIYQNNPEYYERFFEWAFKRGNTIVIVDEAMHICTAAQIGFWYKAILTRGRELNVACWSCTQRPVGVSNFILTEALHWFIFRLNAPDDRKKLKDASGNVAFLTSPKNHDFIYRNADNEGIVKSKLNLRGVKL